jgi:hypothetical protein
MTDVDVACAPDGDGWACSVRIRENEDSTEHEVAIRPPDAAAHRVRSVDDAERLARETVSFLLEREPKESILRAFDLSVVGRYFPEYDREIRRRLGH